VEDVLADEDGDDEDVGVALDVVELDDVFVSELLFVDELLLLDMFTLLLPMDEFNLRSSIIDAFKLLSFRISCCCCCVGDCWTCELLSELSKMTLGVFFKLPDGSFTAEFDWYLDNLLNNERILSRVRTCDPNGFFHPSDAV
jgi:hypothetical protein